MRPSPARREAPDPGAWLPILDFTDELEALDFTGELEALDITGELELLALEEGRVDLERELETLEADFWRNAEVEHPFLTGELPAVPGSEPNSPRPNVARSVASLSIFEASVVEESVLEPGQARSTIVDLPLPPVVRNPQVDALASAIPEEYAEIRPNRPAIVHRRRSLRLRRRVIVTALVVAVLAACVGAVAPVIGGTDPRRDVTVSADGRANTVVTRAATVADLLAARGMTVHPGDRVVPSLATNLQQGMPIRIVRAFPVVVDVDGVVTRRRTTRHRLTNVRRELGLPSGMVVVGERGRIGRGDQIVLRTPRSVNLVVDGTTTPLTNVTALTASELIASREITLGPTDEMQPAGESRLTEGMTVQVYRVGEGEVAEDQQIPFPSEYRDDANLAAGHVRTIQEGRNGVDRVVFKVVRRDGVIVQWTEDRRMNLQQPMVRILARGTKVAGSGTPPVPPATGGRYYQSGTATHYRSHAGAGACAHLTLPFGTILKLVNTANGRTAQCRVGDRGPQAWTGHVIDLNPDVFQALAPLSAGVISLKIYII